MKSFKQYLLEYDDNAQKPMPGYSYDGQEPELRSDEDAEKTKEWYTNVAGDGKPSRTRSGDTQVYQSEVDLEGRPTGRTISSTVISPENKAKAKEDEDAEERKIIQRYRDKDSEKLAERKKSEEEMRERGEFPHMYDKRREREEKEFNAIKVKKFQERQRNWELGKPPMDDLA